MIKQPTTLILGAGASEPYGFPTGYGLLTNVLKRFSAFVATDYFMEVVLKAGCTEDETRKFREALLKSGKMSVDAFLEYRPEFLKVGKIAIAASLIQFENDAVLFQRRENSWYEYLFSQLSTTFEDFGNNRLSILTFNYDRSLEHFLFEALKHTYGRSDQECAAMLARIPIIHLHGDIGGLPYLEQSNTRSYNTEFNTDLLRVAAERVKIIHEGTHDAGFNRAREILTKSKIICFLGFGYHPINVRRLGFTNSPLYDPSYPNAKLWGSTLGLTQAERSVVGRHLGNRLDVLNSKALDCDALQFLRETCLLQSASEGG